MLHHGTIDGSSGINRTGFFRHCLTRVSNIEGVALRLNIIFGKGSIVINKIRGFNFIIVDSIRRIHICSGLVEEDSVTAIYINGIIGYRTSLGICQLNRATVRFAIRAGNGVIIYNEICLVGLKIDATGITGNSVIFEIHCIGRPTEITALVHIGITSRTIIDKSVIRDIFDAGGCGIVMVSIQLCTESTTSNVHRVCRCSKVTIIHATAHAYANTIGELNVLHIKCTFNNGPCWITTCNICPNGNFAVDFCVIIAQQINAHLVTGASRQSNLISTRFNSTINRISNFIYGFCRVIPHGK